jgi:prepilin-type N-terminal cleavage/methylation domain-containing protein
MDRSFALLRHRGFSLIEVLVAAAVLSVGLLALVSLQASLIRSSSDARAFTTATALAKDQLETLRTFDNMKTGASYQALTDGSDTPDATGGVGFTRTWMVSRYVYNQDPDGNPATADGQFVPYASDTGDPPNPYNGNTATGYVDDTEFKRIVVHVTWNDVEGNTRSVALEDAIAAVAPSDAALIAKSGSAIIPRTTEVIINDPTLTNGVANGVIPLALSSDPSVDGTSTAATNPQPKLLGADFRVAETRYDVLTYGAVNNGTAVAQSKIETAVVGCTCSYANANNTVTGFRPTYWNGYRYVPPQQAIYKQPAGWVGADNESAKCTACCRDHHDQVAGADVSGTGAKFDPRRSTHIHYSHDSAGNLVNSNNTGSYEEACRLIRVDGAFRVAADAYTDQVNLLETKNDQSSTPYVPTTQASSNYQKFALNFLDARVVNNGSSSTFNNTLGAGTVTALEGPSSNDTSSTSINVPATIAIDNDQQKWLHARGLYVDYMEPEVVSAILSAKANCAMDNGTGGCALSLAKKEAAVLKLIPFTSINLTEIANWTPAQPADTGGQDVLVYNNLLKCTVPAADGGPAAGCTSTLNGATTIIDPTRPVRGMVQKIKVSAGAGHTPLVLASTYASNSQLAALGRTIDSDEGNPLSDTQQFIIAGNSGSGTSASYKVAVLGTYPLSSGARPVVDTSPASSYIYASTAVSGFTLPNPITVTPNPVFFGVPVTLRLKAYNYALTTPTQSPSITCTGPSGGVLLTATSTNSNLLAGKQTVCKNYAVSSVNINGTAVSGPFTVQSTGTPGSPNGSLTEYTTISLPAVNVNDVVNITMSTEADYLPATTCTYLASDLSGSGGWKGSSVPTVTPGVCPP